MKLQYIDISFSTLPLIIYYKYFLNSICLCYILLPGWVNITTLWRLNTFTVFATWATRNWIKVWIPNSCLVSTTPSNISVPFHFSRVRTKLLWSPTFTHDQTLTILKIAPWCSSRSPKTLYFHFSGSLDQLCLCMEWPPHSSLHNNLLFWFDPI